MTSAVGWFADLIEAQVEAIARQSAWQVEVYRHWNAGLSVQSVP